MPYVVRVERGVINRTPYSFASIIGAAGWNQRLVYQFGGGCGTAYSQGSPLGTDVVDDSLLKQGYAVATANFNTFQTSCNDVLSAETAMMVKEHVAETIGAPRFTIGAGASGGAIQQLMIAQNYPGILDALSPVIPFPDAISIAPGVSDCGLLAHFYAGAGAGLTHRAARRGQRPPDDRDLRALDLVVPGHDRPVDRVRPAHPEGADLLGRRTRTASAARCRTSTATSSGSTPRPGTRTGRSTTSACSTGCGRSTRERSPSTSSSTLNEDVGGYDINGQIHGRA